MSDLDVKSLRVKLGLTQAQLAETCGVSARTVQNWEGNNVVIPESKKILLMKLIGENEHETVSPSVSPSASSDENVLFRAFDEIAAQRRVTEKAQAQIDELLSIVKMMSQK